MDEETWLGAKKAVDLGFADGVLFSKEETDDNTMNGIVRGMRTIYNSLSSTTVNTGELLRHLKAVNHEAWELARAQLAIEQNRF